MKQPEIRSEVANKPEISSEVQGQSTYKYHCPQCGNVWYDSWGSSSQCPNCGAWGVLD